MRVKAIKPAQGISPEAKLPASEIPAGLRIVAVLLRTLFVGILVVLIARVSLPQSESISSAYETTGDLIRVALGVTVGLGLLLRLFMPPKDAEACRTWVYLGLAVAPFALLCLIAVW
ncbi:MAG: hypothetical protein ABSA62_12085 [Methyloceanibacter sp.]|jgi:hypothetical protein